MILDSIYVLTLTILHFLQLAFENIPGTAVSYVFPEFTQEDLDDKMRLKQCFPLYSMLSAAGLTSLDFLSLDVEGIDHLVLKSLPWKKVDIKVTAHDDVSKLTGGRHKWRQSLRPCMLNRLNRPICLNFGM